MTAQWTSCKLGDIITLQRGYDLPQRNRIIGDIPIVTSSGITGYHNVAKAKGPGVVTGRYGTLGVVFYVEQDYWPHNTALFVRDFKGNYPHFIKYFLSTLGLSYYNVAGAVPGVNRNALHMLEVSVPPVPVQRKIAAILAAYDDLIDNNIRRINILEEITQNTYREWFVKFRFPGHEKIKMVDSEFGMIPEGWNYESILKSPFFDLIEDNVKPYVGKMKYFATADVNRIELEGKGIEYYFKDKPSRAQKQPILHSVWFARMQDTYKVLAFSPINNELALHSMLSSGFVGFKTRFEQSLPFLYCTIGSEEFHKLKDLYCTGATQRSLTNEGMRHIEVVVPTNDVVLEFGRCVQPMLDQLLILQQKNIILRQCRDLLLPKLISGQIDVSDLDIKVEEDA